jgi:CRP-like cAMP-binding protein
MVLSWLARHRRPQTADNLVARGQYARALALLRVEFEKRQPTAAERLRFADLLVLVDRGNEALPILLGVADELSRYGFHEKALEALRRADAIEPGLDEVRRRFKAVAVAAQQRRAEAMPASPATVPAPGPPPAATAAGSGATPVEEEKTNPVGVPVGSDGDPDSAPEPSDALERRHDRELYAFVRALGERPAGPGRTALAAALFADLSPHAFRRVSRGLRRLLFPPGDMVVNEGERGDSIFLITRGDVRVLVVGGHGRSFEIRRLDAGDFFGEVAALSGRARTATVVAGSVCELLEVDRWALDRLVATHVQARPILEDACVGRVSSPEESAVRSLSPELASPERAAAVLKAHFGDCHWSPRVRVQLARQMLDTGQEEEALAVLASVAEELAGSDQAQTAIAILKHIERIRKRGEQVVCLAPLHKPAGPPAPSPAGPVRAPVASPASRAATEAAFREWVGSLLHETGALSGGPTPGTEEEGADGERHRQGGSDADRAAEARG